MNKNQEILSLAVLAGEILIKNGGEIFRVSHKKRRHRVSSMSSHNFYSSYCSSALAIAIWKWKIR